MRPFPGETPHSRAARDQLLHRRLVPRAEGSTATTQRGLVIYEDGGATGALPGPLMVGPQPRT